MQIPNQTTNQSSEPVRSAPLPEPSSVFSSPQGIFYLVLSQWKMVLACVILSTALGASYAYLATPIFEAEARIEVLNDSRIDTRSKTSYDRQERSLSRQLLLLNSSRLHKKVIDLLRPTWAPRLGSGELNTYHTVSSVQGSNGSMIDIRVEAVNAEYATQYIVSMIEVYRQLRIEELNEVNASAVTGLRVEESRVLAELESAKQQLTEFEHTNQMQLAQEREAMDTAFVNQLFERLQTIRLERVLLENQKEAINGSDVATILEALQMTRETQVRGQSLPDAEEVDEENRDKYLRLMDTSSVNAESQNLEAVLNRGKDKEALAKLKREYEQQLEIRKEAHPAMIALRQEIEELEYLLESQVQLSLERFQARYDALKLQEAGIEDVLSSWTQGSVVSVERQNAYRQLVAKVALLEKKYDLVYSRLLENTGATESFFLRKIQEPFSNGRAIKPQEVKVLGAAIIFGLLLSGGLVIGFEYIRPKELNVEQLKRDFHLTYLSPILRWNLYLPPDKFNPATDQFVAVKGDNQIATETYRRIRINILKELGEPEKFSFAVTSGKGGDGKTFNSANIAVPFVWEGKRVLLIDADLRRSSLTKNLMGHPLKHGLADWLHDESCDLQQYIVKLNDDSLYVLPAGTYDDSLPELVNPRKLRYLIQSLQQSYDVVILDTAPVTVLSETISLCQATDGVVLLMDTLSHQYDVQHCINELRGVRIIGFCVNNVDGTRLKRGKYGSYGAYGAYGVYPNDAQSIQKKGWLSRLL